MILGFHDPTLGRGAPLSALAAGRHPLLAELTGHWAATAPKRIARCARELINRGTPGSLPARVFLVPGRIEVLGKHTDYAGGRSLLAAVERGFVLIAAPRRDNRVRMTGLGVDGAAEFALVPELQPSSGWSTYPMTVARRLARDFPGIGPGAEIAFHSDLPSASGMSSSSALMVGTFLCLASISELFTDPRFLAEVGDPDELASYLAAVECGQGFGRLSGDAGVGTHGGSEDHTAILRAEAARVLQYRFVPAVLERTIFLPGGHRFAIASSGVEAAKAGAMRDRYNRASALARALRDIWHRAGYPAVPSLAGALRSSPEALERLRQGVREIERPGFPVRDLLTRLEHFVQESEVIVPAAANALAEGKLDQFGARVDDSQRLAAQLLGNQIPETIELARSARSLGAVAASAFGAGYGGSVWALVEDSGCAEFLRGWRSAYAAAYPGPAERAAFFDSAAGPPARRLV